MCLKSSQIVCKKESAIHHHAVFEFSKEQIYEGFPREEYSQKNWVGMFGPLPYQLWPKFAIFPSLFLT